MWIEFSDKKLDTTVECLSKIQGNKWLAQAENMSVGPTHRIVLFKSDKNKNSVWVYCDMVEGKKLYHFVHCDWSRGPCRQIAKESYNFFIKDGKLLFEDEKIQISADCTKKVAKKASRWDEKVPKFNGRSLVYDSKDEKIYLKVTEDNKRNFIFEVEKDGETKVSYPFYLRIW